MCYRVGPSKTGRTLLEFESLWAWIISTNVSNTHVLPEQPLDISIIKCGSFGPGGWCHGSPAWPHAETAMAKSSIIGSRTADRPCVALCSEDKGVTNLLLLTVVLFYVHIDMYITLSTLEY